MRPDALYLEVELEPGVWTDTVDRLDMRRPVRIETGKQDDLLVADVGHMSWRLLNRDGAFTPTQAEVWEGWGVGVPVRLRAKVGDTTFEVFYGELGVISPKVAEGVVECVAFDGVYRLKEDRVPLAGLLEDVEPGDLVKLLVAHSYYPPQQAGLWRFDHEVYGAFDTGKFASGDEGYDVDEGESVFPWAGDQWRSEDTNVLAALGDVCLSELGHFSVKRDGRVCFEGRTRRAACDEDAFEFDAANIVELHPVEHVERWYDEVRVRVHPREKEEEAVVVWSMGDSSIRVVKDKDRELGMPFGDPDGEAIRVGVWEVVPLEEGVDYEAWDSSTNPKVELTGYLDISPRYSLERGEAVLHFRGLAGRDKCYVTQFQQRGKLLKAYQAVEAISACAEQMAVRGRKVLALDMRLQSDVDFAWEAANFLAGRFRESSDWVTLRADSRVGEAELVAALSLDVGDRVCVTDGKTGLSAGRFFVERRSVEVGVRIRGWFTCSPAEYEGAWVFDRSRFDEDAVFAL